MPIDFAQEYNTPELQQLKENAQTAAGTAGQYQSAASMLPMKLKQAIQEKLDYNKDIIDQQNKAMAEYFKAPSAAREKYQNIWNPFEREKLVAAERANAYTPYANLTDILSQRMGQIGDLVTAGTGAFNSAVTASANQAQQARQSYLDALTMADAIVKGKQWNYEQTHKGTGIENIDLNLPGVKTTPTKNITLPTEPKPKIKPGQNIPVNLRTIFHSTEGQWIFSWKHNEWIPAEATKVVD